MALPTARSVHAVVVLGVAVAASVAAPPAMAAPAPDNCVAAGQVIREVPWPQQMLGLDRVRQFASGGNLTVAVLDSGVDAKHPQLAGRVDPGFDAVTGSGRADSDCLGTGTQVAGVIAAQRTGSVGLVGVAQRTRILPIRVIADQRSEGAVAQPDVLARGINAAVDRRASVIAVSTITYTDSPALRSAVANADSHGVIVVAAVGDRGGSDAGNPTPYPASYPGVLGVGAIGQGGDRWSGSQHGSYVDLVAPGAEVVTLQRAGGMTSATGTGIACGFVAGVAALILAKRGSVGPNQVRRLMQATAVPMANGRDYGRGMVNPYAAVNDELAGSSAQPLPALVRPSHPASSAWAHSRQVAITGTLIAIGVVLAVLVLAMALPRGRRRFWRSALSAPPSQSEELNEPGPPVLLFDDRP